MVIVLINNKYNKNINFISLILFFIINKQNVIYIPEENIKKILKKLLIILKKIKT